MREWISKRDAHSPLLLLEVPTISRVELLRIMHTREEKKLSCSYQLARYALKANLDKLDDEFTFQVIITTIYGCSTHFLLRRQLKIESRMRHLSFLVSDLRLIQLWEMLQSYQGLQITFLLEISKVNLFCIC